MAAATARPTVKPMPRRKADRASARPMPAMRRLARAMPKPTAASAARRNRPAAWWCSLPSAAGRHRAPGEAGPGPPHGPAGCAASAGRSRRPAAMAGPSVNWRHRQDCEEDHGEPKPRLAEREQAERHAHVAGIGKDQRRQIDPLGQPGQAQDRECDSGGQGQAHHRGGDISRNRSRPAGAGWRTPGRGGHVHHEGGDEGSAVVVARRGPSHSRALRSGTPAPSPRRCRKRASRRAWHPIAGRTLPVRR